MLLYVLCTAGEFVWNEGGVVPATCYLRLISRCVIVSLYLTNFRGGIEGNFAGRNISYWLSALWGKKYLTDRQFILQVQKQGSNTVKWNYDVTVIYTWVNSLWVHFLGKRLLFPQDQFNVKRKSHLVCHLMLFHSNCIWNISGKISNGSLKQMPLKIRENQTIHP